MWVQWGRRGEGMGGVDPSRGGGRGGVDPVGEEEGVWTQ